MAEITERFTGLNPYAPEFFPSQKLLSLSDTSSALLTPYYPPPPRQQPINPIEYYLFSSCFHQLRSTFTSTTPSIYPANPFPTQTQPAHDNFVLPSTEQTIPKVVPHVEEEQQPLHHGEIYQQLLPLRKRVYSTRSMNKRLPFGHGGLGSSIGEKKISYKYENRQAVRPASLGFDYNYKGFNCRSRSSGKGNNLNKCEYYSNNWSSMEKKAMNKKYSDVLPVLADGDNTTVMIRNIPNKYSFNLLMEFLDNHCAMENLKLEVVGGGDNSAYDFLYLPIDFETECNKGYAFVNFTNPKAVWKFKLATHSQSWELFNSSKIREIACAKIQGKKNLVSHFETMGFPCASDDVLPVCFDPPRDGSGSCVQHTTVGIPIHREPA